MNRRRFLKRSGGLILAAFIAPKVAADAVVKRFAVLPVTGYGEISPRTSGVIAKKLLERTRPGRLLSKFGRDVPLVPEKSKWRRHESHRLMPTAERLNTKGIEEGGSYGF